MYFINIYNYIHINIYVFYNLSTHSFPWKEQSIAQFNGHLTLIAITKVSFVNDQKNPQKYYYLPCPFCSSTFKLVQHNEVRT